MHRAIRLATPIFTFIFAAASSASGAAQTKTLAEPTELAPTSTSPHNIHFDLDVKYADFTIYNPATGKNDPVHLRTYNGLPVGPTMRMYPGDTLTVSLKNDLPKQDAPCDTGDSPDHNTPNCFNITNLHTHGFHVSPNGISDNVLLQVFPDTTQPYEIKLHADHPAGTFWYHSHRHGATALQVSSGMEGALIVKGTRTYADKLAHGGLADIDTVLKQKGGKKVTERVAVLQQIQYSCLDKDKKLTWDCSNPSNVDQVGRIEGYGPAQFGPKSWDQSGRFTLINGLVQPTVPVHAGQIYRWRLIHAGVHDTIGLRITRSSLGSPKLLAAVQAKGVAPADEEDFVKKYCLLDQTVPQFEFAADGLTRTSMSKKLINVLQPGYRSDILTVLPEKGTFCVIDDLLSPAGEINTEDYEGRGADLDAPVKKGRHLLALITAVGTAKVNTAKMETYLGDELYKGNPELPADVRSDLGKLQIAAFSPHETIPDSAITGKQVAEFNIVGTPVQFEVNGKPYSDDPADTRMLTLNATDEWTLTSKLASHPFHIHVNPFEIVKITKTDGNKEVDIFANGHCTDLDLKDPAGNPTPDPQYCDQIGVFRDTFFVKQGYQVYIRSHYTDFAGAFVLHCHILDHEDQGMMQNVFIQDPLHPIANPFTGAGHNMQH